MIPADVTPPDDEARAADTTLGLPLVPSFELPPAPADGVVDPRYLRVNGRKVLDTTIKVRGYIIWIYNCVDDVRGRKESRAAAQRRIDDDPTQCERPKFYLGSAKTTPVERGLWVVDVPRPPNKLEKTRLPKQELAAWPKVPRLKVGDYVELTGDFKIASPHNERNSDGLVVFASIAPVKPAKPAKVAKTPAAPPTTTQVAPVTITPAVRPTFKAIEPRKRDLSLVALAKGNAAYVRRNHADAIAAYREAIAAWDENHLAWYGLGGGLASRGEWAQAFEAFEHCRTSRPDVAMYQLWSGVAAYESAVKIARENEATRTGGKPEEVSVDLSIINYAQARDRLEMATRLGPDMWRAHYFLGRIYRNEDRAQLAAEQFTQAVLHAPAEQGPYVALGELYRKWDYTKEAIVVTAAGSQRVPAGEAVSDVYFVLGMAHDDLGANAAAIDAFTKAVEAKPTNYKALFQRGQAYFRTGKLAEAKGDLEAVEAAGGPSLAFANQQAHKMLLDIEAKKPSKK